MRLQLTSWPMIERYLERSQAILIPIGSTEQHGPGGYLGTDALCPEAVALAVGERRELLVAPTIAIGMAQQHMRFPGSLTLRPSTLIAVIVDLAASLHAHGFEQLYFLNGHGGNIATVKAAFSEYHAGLSLGPPGSRTTLQTYLRNWWDGERVRDYTQASFGEAEGSHATPSEISLTYHLHGSLSETGALNPEVAPRGGFFDAEDYRRKFADGRIGSNPALASAAHGKRLLEAAIADTEAHLDQLGIH